ncbi:HNH endonuclease signature motif containing protein [uncultured Microbacterium sp.]|uniref:HNH nuclease domain-containing protein n=1 Tax=uncultured Microbacterium sp. TaxID=191216 RepID=A0A1Y5P4Q4_9MICO|nr:HNH endonuclease signature motif containing protein [uncultured Microbacterium sp.]SBS70928.1 conserved hypothetical protein [uncultured Microbacterium sp.]
MQALLAHLTDIIGQTREQVRTGLADGEILCASDEDLVHALSLAGELQRLTDAVLIEAVGEIDRRSIAADRDLRLTSRFGCHDVVELVQRATLVGPATAARLRRAADDVRVGVSLAQEPMPAPLPAMRAALLEGAVGIDGVLAVGDPLRGLRRRVNHDDLLAADEILAAEARGSGPDGAPPACADLLRIQARAWAAALDQDGAEPREEKALRLRGLTFGTAHDGVVPVSGALLVEVAAQFQRLHDAIVSPRTAGPVFRPEGSEPTVREDDDVRTSAQKRHDTFASVLFTAASSALLPTIGGAAPTLVVSVREEDLLSGTGWAHIDGADEPVSVAAARHSACTGVVQRVLLGANGRVKRIGTEERVFNRHQRRAIALRDGNCLIPGCGVPAGWCEIHHVTEHARGGATHTDNGVLLCWFHHRHLDRSGWRIRMNRGVPEVLPPVWIEADPRWRVATTSPTRLLDSVRRRI